MFWLRRAFWFVLIVGGIFVVLAMIIFDVAALRILLTAVAVVGLWILAGIGSAWLFGAQRHLEKHLALRLAKAVRLDHAIESRIVDDAIRALQQISEQSGGRVFGVSPGFSIAPAAEAAWNFEPVALEWRSSQTSATTWQSIPENALFLIRVGKISCIAVVATREDSPGYRRRSSASLSGPKTHLTLLARTQDDASVCRDFLLEETRKASVFRGQTLVIRSGESQRDPIRVEFSEIRPVSRERIILPDSLFETLDRSALRQLEIADSLAAAGLRTRTAVLLYGPPGTGKTLLTRYMVASCKGLTTILLHGFTRGLVREAFRIARYCEPSIVVIEDVDLIALARHKRSGGTSSLHELMDELDGLVPESRTIVVMTTNRPDVLEPALASRPGRVSQAIEVPLPDAESRLRILKLFTSRMDISQVDLNQWVSRTSGASPAFLEELIRRAATFALGTSETSKKRETIRLTNAELESAIREILVSGGLLTRRLLGFDATNGNPA